MAFKRMAITAALLALVLQGCRTSPRADEHFGESVRANLAAQVANPRAAPNTNPAAGVDGQAARGAQERYEKSFMQREKAQEQSLISTMGR
jgi:hypothetical protein